MKKLEVKDLKDNFFEAIGKEWMLITAGTKEKFNTMTASWGGIGWLWNKPVAFVFVRPERYTYEFIEKSDYLTLSFLGEENKKIHAVCGSKSGRNTDKVKETGLKPVFTEGGNVVFEQARLSLECKKLYADGIKPECFLDKESLEKWYGGAHGGYQEFHCEGGDGDDIFGDIFGSMFGGGRNNKGFHRSSFHQGGFGSSGGFGGSGFRSGSFKQKGSDAHADISISFDEAVTGCDKVIHLQDQNGVTQSLQVHIPAGIDTGKSVRLRGKGNPGMGGGEAGDLFLKVTVGEKPGFERKGNDVYTTINVPFSTAVCGGEAVIKTLYGNVICKIKEGTQSGSKIRLRGKGMPLMKNPSQKGDQYAVVQIQVPRNVSQQAKNKLKEFDSLCGGRGKAAY